MNPVIASLEENLKQIKLIAEPTQPAFAKDKGNTGDIKEVTIQEFLASYLTSDFKIKKGSIYNKTEVSNNIDCVVLFPNHPKLITPLREVIIAEGVYAAIEVKPDISTLTEKSEFRRGLLQIQSVKKLKRNRVRFDLDAFGITNKPSDYFDRIPGVIFSFKSQSFSNVISYIQKLIGEGVISDEEIPDIIISIDQGVLFYCPKIRETIFEPYLDAECASYPDRVFVEISETGASQLIWFLRLFLTLPNPSVTLSDPILQDYLDVTIEKGLKFHSLDESEEFLRRPDEVN